MDRENVQNMVLLAIGIALLLVPAFLVPMAPLLIAAYVAIFVGLALAVGPWIWRFTLGTMDASPAETIAYLVRRLRMAGHVVHTEPHGLTAAIGGEALVALNVEPQGNRSRILYRANATAVGWLSVVRLPRIYRRVRAWGRDAATAVVPKDGRLPPPAPPGDPQAMLVDALSETNRFAAEAFAGEREKYQNSQALLILSAIMVWFLLFIGLSSTSPDADVSRRIATSAGWAFAVTLPVSALGSWLIRRSRRGRMVELREWADRLQEALQLEAAPTRERGREGSSLELLLLSHAEVPRWLDAARKASMGIDPMGWWAVFTMVYVGVDLLLWEAPAVAALSLPLAAIVGIAGIGVLAGAGVYYSRWRRRREEMLARSKADWDLSYERLRGEMEQYFGRL